MKRGTFASIFLISLVLMVQAAEAVDVQMNGNVGVSGSVTATSFSGIGSGLTSLDPANITSGTANINISGNAATATTSTTATNFSGSLSGDVTGTQGATSVSKLQGVSLSAAAPSTGQTLLYNGTQWAPGSISTAATTTLLNTTFTMPANSSSNVANNVTVSQCASVRFTAGALSAPSGFTCALRDSTISTVAPYIVSAASNTNSGAFATFPSLSIFLLNPGASLTIECDNPDGANSVNLHFALYCQ